VADVVGVDTPDKCPECSKTVLDANACVCPACYSVKYCGKKCLKKHKQHKKSGECARLANQLGRVTDEDAFTNAFNACRGTLAGFAKCRSTEELHIVRDLFFLEMASLVCPVEYDPVKAAIVSSEQVAISHGTVDGVQRMVEAARQAGEGVAWAKLLRALMAVADEVGSDLLGIWGGLERGRLEWLKSVSFCHKLKTTLKAQITKDGFEGADAKMVWLYSMATMLPSCNQAAANWAVAAHIPEVTNPLKGYKEDEWDPQRPEWAPVDRGVAAAAERGGSSLDEAWEAE